MSYRIIPVPEFQKNVKTLRKKYRHIALDLQELNTLLSDNPCYGDAIEGLEGKVFKARLASSDMKAGKSKGYRLIYYYSKEDDTIYLLTIYAKAFKENISISEIKIIIKNSGL